MNSIYFDKKEFKLEWKKDYIKYKLFYLDLVLALCLLLPLIVFCLGVLLELLVLAIIGVVGFLLLFLVNKLYVIKKLSNYLVKKNNEIFDNEFTPILSYYPIYFKLDNKKLSVIHNENIIFECYKKDYKSAVLMIDYTKELKSFNDLSSKDTIYSLMIYTDHNKKPFIIDLNVFFINNRMKRVKKLFILNNVKVLLNTLEQFKNW